MTALRNHLFLAALLMAGLVAGAPAKATMHSFHDFKVKRADGHEVALSAYKGKVVLVVNTASRCGFTPQYEALEALQKRYAAKGFSGAIPWNFTKFLVGPGGNVLARFDPATTPDDAAVTAAIEHALAVKAK